MRLFNKIPLQRLIYLFTLGFLWHLNYLAINALELQGETWDLQQMKGIMKGQTLRMSRIVNYENSYHSCYQAQCLGKGCPYENATIQFCYPAIVITGLPKCGTSAMYDLLTRYSDTVIMTEKENCPYARRRPHWQYFSSLPSFDSIKKYKIAIDGCIEVNANMIMRNILRQPKTLYVVSILYDFNASVDSFIYSIHRY